MVSREQVSEYVQDKLTFYHAMIRNGWVLPAYKQAICTYDFMVKVRAQQVWCPKKDAVTNVVLCATPPPRKELAELIHQAVINICCSNKYKDEDLESLCITDEIIQKKLGDTQWLLTVLSVLDSDHPVFAKDYIYIKPSKAKAVNALPLLDNSDGFFNNLPQLSMKQRKNGRVLRLSKTERQSMQLKALEMRKQEIDEKVDALKSQIEQESQQEEMQASSVALEEKKQEDDPNAVKSLSSSSVVQYNPLEKIERIPSTVRKAKLVAQKKIMGERGQSSPFTAVQNGVQSMNIGD